MKPMGHQTVRESPILDDALRRQPPTSQELRRGRILRVVAIWRSSEGVFEEGPASHVISIALIRRKDKRSHPLLHVLVSRHPLLGQSTTIASTLFDLSEAAAEFTSTVEWVVDEYEVTLPIRGNSILFLCAGEIALLTNEQRAHLYAEYERRIENASVFSGYHAWHDAIISELVKRSVPAENYLLSIVTPAYRTPPEFLRQMIDSVRSQTYQRWELVLVNASPECEEMSEVIESYDDSRIRVIKMSTNLGIVGNTNVGIAACSGDYVCFFDHDDLIEPCALAEIVRSIPTEDGPADLLYCDEDNIDEEGIKLLPIIKPDLNYDLLLNNDYVLHWLTVRREMLNLTARSESDVEGAQDYDLTLKVVERGGRVVHIPYVLYHWRICPGSSSADPSTKMYAQEAGATAIRHHLDRNDIRAHVERGRAFFTYDVSYELSSGFSKLTVVGVGGLSRATNTSLSDLADGNQLDIKTIAVSSECTAAEFLSTFGNRSDGPVLFVSAAIDLDLTSLSTLCSMLSCKDVGSVSPRVIREDGLNDYAGFAVRSDGHIVRLLQMLPEMDGGYIGRAERPYDAWVVNPECVLVSDDIIDIIISSSCGDNSLYTEMVNSFAVAYDRGYSNIYLPRAIARLNQSRSMMFNDVLCLSPSMRKKYDPSQNPFFDMNSSYYRLIDEQAARDLTADLRVRGRAWSPRT